MNDVSSSNNSASDTSPNEIMDMIQPRALDGTDVRRGLQGSLNNIARFIRDLGIPSVPL